MLMWHLTTVLVVVLLWMQKRSLELVLCQKYMARELSGDNMTPEDKEDRQQQ
jgi:hypothetical protein